MRQGVKRAIGAVGLVLALSVPVFAQDGGPTPPTCWTLEFGGGCYVICGWNIVGSC